MNFDDWSDRHRQTRAALNADQVEIRAIMSGISHIDTGIEDERMAGVIDDELTEAGNSWGERQCILEDLSGEIGEEIERRRSVMKHAYPFEITGSGGLKYEPSKTGVYEFCLAVGGNPTGESKQFPKASAIFEFIARDAVRIHFGEGTKGFRTGAPSYDFENRGNSARETFSVLGEQCGEFRWNPEHGFPAEPSYRDLKDAGLDIVIWKPWLDGRFGHFFALGQCACGKNDLTLNKANELSLQRLAMWLRPVCHTQPTRCFLVSHHIPNTAWLYALSKIGGLVFDRARISLIAETAADQITEWAQVSYHDAANIYAVPTTAK